MENNHLGRILHLTGQLLKGFLVMAGVYILVLLFSQVKPPSYSDVGIPGDLLDGIGLMLFGLLLLFILLVWWVNQVTVEISAWPNNLLKSGLSILVLLCITSAFLVITLWLLLLSID